MHETPRSQRLFTKFPTENIREIIFKSRDFGASNREIPSRSKAILDAQTQDGCSEVLAAEIAGEAQWPDMWHLCRRVLPVGVVCGFQVRSSARH